MSYFQSKLGYNRYGTALGMSYLGAKYGTGALLANGTRTNVALGGRNRFRARTINQPMSDLVKKRSVRRKYSFKAHMKASEPAKHFTASDNVAMTHNTIYTMIPTQGITQGTGNTQRIGDDVTLAALKIHGYWQSNQAANGYRYRILVGYTGEEYAVVGIANSFQSGLSSTELFLPNTAATNTVDGIINPKAVTVLYDETFDLNSQIATVVDVQSIAQTVQLNKDFMYQASGSVQGKTVNLFIAVIGEVSNGVSGTTSAGNAIMSIDLIYKD